MRYIKELKIKSLVEEEIKMLYWLLAYTLLVDKKTNPALSRVLLVNHLISGAFVVRFLFFT